MTASPGSAAGETLGGAVVRFTTFPRTANAPSTAASAATAAWMAACAAAIVEAAAPSSSSDAADCSRGALRTCRMLRSWNSPPTGATRACACTHTRSTPDDLGEGARKPDWRSETAIGLTLGMRTWMWLRPSSGDLRTTRDGI
eukprot:4955695-Prymnesium_polylepis.1